MYGKIYDSLFTGSMVGAGSDVFAVWAYVIANTQQDGNLELNPKLLAFVIGTSEEGIRKAIDYLCSPDPTSRSQVEDGRRLAQEGTFLYRVVNHGEYQSLRQQSDLREYMRDRKREQRERDKRKQSNENMSLTVFDGPKTMSNLSHHIDIDKEVSISSCSSSSLRSEDSQKEISPEPETVSGAPGGETPSPERAASPPEGAPGETPTAKKAKDGAKPPPTSRPPTPAEIVFNAWKQELNHPRSVFDKHRKKFVLDALKYFSVEELCRVPVGVKRSMFHMGKNDRNTVYDDVSVVFKNAKNIELFLALAEGDQPERSQSEADKVIAEQEACGCYDMGGLRKIMRDNKAAYIPCDHNKAVQMPVQEAQWPPPLSSLR